MPAEEGRPTRQAALWLAFLGPYFFAVYSFCNWYASTRPSVRSFFFEWERDLPFVPWLFIPYLSIDLFFCTSLFLCRTPPELAAHARRFLFTISVSALFFLFLPLRFAWDKPEVPGFLGVLFAQFLKFDKPFNQAPSLHISLLVLMWWVHARHLGGAARLALHVWFAAIVVSTVLTFQHHVIDLPTGALVAVVAFHLFPYPADRTVRKAPKQSYWTAVHRRLGAAYLVPAIVLAAIALAVSGWALVLLWPATSLGLVASAYLGLGPAVFRKRDGRLPFSAWLLLLPYLLGVRVSIWLQSRGEPAFSEVVPGLFVGRILGESEARHLIARGVGAVVDLTAELPETPALRRLAYLNLPVLDLVPPTPEDVRLAVAFRKEHCGALYVHCALGYGRSVAVVIAMLVAEGVVRTSGEGLALVRKARPRAVAPGAV